MIPPTISVARVIKVLAALRGGSYHHQEGLLSLTRAQDYIYKLLKGQLFPVHFSRLGEMLCSNDILYHFLCYAHSTVSS